MKDEIMISLFSAALLLTGCGMTNERVVYMTSDDTVVPDVQAEPPRVIEPTQQDMQRRFETRPEEDGTAVRNAVLWAQKYEELSVRNNELREQNNKLYLENHRLQRETDTLKLQLEQTKKDLNEANDFLQQMHLELTQWKSDVLGFRDEIRTSQKAQIEAMNKILSVLGAEPVEIPAGQGETSVDEVKE